MNTLPLPGHSDNPNTKPCSVCKKNLPRTREHFYADKRSKDGLQSACKKCQLVDKKVYAQEHKEEIKLYKDKYNLDHREQHKLYLKEHSEEISEQQRIYYGEHQEHLRQYSSQYRQTERGRMSVKAWNHNRKARKKNAKGSLTAEEMQEQYIRQRGRCYYCRAKLGKGRGSWHGDHVIPLSRGGSNSIDNIVIACPKCNQSKYNKLLHEWREGGRLL